MGLFSRGQSARLQQEMTIEAVPFFDGYQFSLKGSPRHYDDVLKIIRESGEAEVYFGEALAYERGAGIALWRIRARDFGWLDTLYDWWVEMERVEPMDFTFHLYFPDNPKYPAMDLREHAPGDVAAFIKNNAPYVKD